MSVHPPLRLPVNSRLATANSGFTQRPFGGADSVVGCLLALRRSITSADGTQGEHDSAIGAIAKFPTCRVRSARSAAPAIPHAQSGMLSCFFQGLLSFLFLRLAKARATRRRVEWGMITSSMKPRSAATKGLAKRAS